MISCANILSSCPCLVDMTMRFLPFLMSKETETSLIYHVHSSSPSPSRSLINTARVPTSPSSQRPPLPPTLHPRLSRTHLSPVSVTSSVVHLSRSLRCRLLLYKVCLSSSSDQVLARNLTSANGITQLHRRRKRSTARYAGTRIRRRNVQRPCFST